MIKHYKDGIPFPTKISDYVCTDDELFVKELDQPRKYPCRLEEVLGAKIGNLTFLAIQGEPLAQIGMRIKEALRERGGPAMVFGYFGERNVYIPTRENVRLDLYQSQVIREQYACPVGWSLDVEDETIETCWQSSVRNWLLTREPANHILCAARVHKSLLIKTARDAIGPSRSAVRISVVLLGDPLSMPGQQRVGSNYRG